MANNLSTVIKSIQDIMRKDDGVDGDAQRLGQLTWMLFLKVFDQREDEWAGDDRTYRSPLEERFRWRTWAAHKVDAKGKKQPQKPASEIISFVNNELFPALKELPVPAKRRGESDVSHQAALARIQVVSSVFKDANNFMKSGTQFQEVALKLDEAIDFHDFTTRASLGDVYEQLLNDLRGAGNAGEFYTPRAITQFMVDRVNPRLKKKQKVLDPACGTGGFLTAAIDHFRHQLTARSSADDKRAIEGLIQGIEKKQLPHLLCTTNLLLHGIDIPNQIEHGNTLAKAWNDWSANERVHCIITNPPFGGYEDDSVGAGYHHPTKETADLFMQLIVKLLREKGRAAVVLPDGFLFGDGIKNDIKQRLMRQCKLHTIIRLPKGVFAPYTTIKTNLLFFTKGALVDDGSEHYHTDTVWFYDHPYPAGYKSYSKTKPIRFEEFKAEQDWWGSEDDNFAARDTYDANPDIADKRAWKYDFAKARTTAEAAAKPYWAKADDLQKQAAAAAREANDVKDSIKGDAPSAKRTKSEARIDQLRAQAESLRQQARDAQAAGDRIYWPIFNLDRKNPSSPDEEIHDPEILLAKYKKLLSEIEETENQLKSELAGALAHHRMPEEAQS
jgi:type I restriction enzyme M protein